MMRLCLFILIVGLCQDVSKATDCVARGRFPNNDEADCRGYTMCIPTGATFMQYKLTCPLGSVYSHIEQQCTTAATYQCHPNYTCNETGNFEDSEFRNCTSFVSCAVGLSGFVTARRIECGTSQVFVPGDGGCVNINETTFKCNPTVETTTVEVTTLVEHSIGFSFTTDVPLNSVGEVRLDLLIVLYCVFCFVIKSI